MLITMSDVSLTPT